MHWMPSDYGPFVFRYTTSKNILLRIIERTDENPEGVNAYFSWCLMGRRIYPLGTSAQYGTMWAFKMLGNCHYWGTGVSTGLCFVTRMGDFGHVTTYRLLTIYSSDTFVSLQHLPTSGYLLNVIYRIIFSLHYLSNSDYYRMQRRQ